MACNRFQPVLGRRSLLRNAACGFGSLAFASLAAEAAGTAGLVGATGPLTPKLPHAAPRAKRVIFLLMWGGPSHVETFDPKPRLAIDDNKPLPASILEKPYPGLGNVLGSRWKFTRRGRSGLWMSELWPHLATQADRLCMLKSVHTEGRAHGEALLRLHTGAANLVRPSMGAWVSYGLGTENQNLPGFITISPPRGHGGVQNYGNAFLPVAHQGLAIGSAEVPVAKATIANLGNDRLDPQTQQRQLETIRALGGPQLDRTGQDDHIDGVIDSMELAFRMQSTMPGIMDLAAESKDTHAMYGIDEQPTDNFGRQCLLARRFAEAGVRYIQVSTDYTWDHHQQLEKGLPGEFAKVDKPIAGLLADLDARGMLEDTLVVYGSEFGRTPTSEAGTRDGRNHHPDVFTMWMAGGGVRGGMDYGTSDDYGFFPQEDPVHMHDVHATILHLLGMDHERLTYRYAGRDFRLTDVHGDVVKRILA